MIGEPRKPKSGRGGRRAGAGRPRGRSEALIRGEKLAVAQLAELAKRRGWDNPVIRECLDMLLRIARAERGYRGRYIGVRLQSITQLLDGLAGRPREAPGPDDGDRGALRELMDQVNARAFEPDDEPSG